MDTQSKYWVPEKIWPDQMCFIIGGGTSLKSWTSSDWQRLHDKHVIGCNDAYALGGWVDVCYFGDNNWINIHKHFPQFKKFEGMKIAVTPENPNCPDVKWVQRRPRGLWNKPGSIGWNRSTGISAIGLAIAFGCARIVLIGFDMYLDSNGKNNWHENLIQTVEESVFVSHIEGAEYVKDQLNRFPDVKVWNATPKSAMKTFPIIMPEDVL